MNRIFLPVLIFLFYFNPATAQSKIDNPYQASVDSLIAQMTLEEKIGQLNLPVAGDITTGQSVSSGVAEKIRAGKVGGLFNIKSVEEIKTFQRVAVEESRMGIPLLFAMDIIHGYETMFPIPLGLSSCWDMDLIERSARIAAEEASTEGLCWTFSPMVDISRDPRWGRVSEGSGEDPYLGSQIARAMVNGYQGNDLSENNTILSCVKHFALYGASEAGRDYNTVDMSRQKMYNDYFPPYKAAVDAGVGSVMTSFNEVDGIPASANRWLMTEVLRNQWGFDGFVVTDYTAINEMTAHGLGNLATVSAKALQAGVDMDMVGEGFLTTLPASLRAGEVSKEQIDAACRRILMAKYELGLFDDPYRYCRTEEAAQVVFSSEHRQEAREMAAQTLVLLKNEDNVLPLRKTGKIALVGPLAKNRENMPGTWSVAANFSESVSLYDGLTQAVGDSATLVYARGANVVEDSLLESRISIFGKPTYRDSRSAEAMIAEALEVSQDADVIIAAVGEAAEMSGESASRTDINLPESQRKLLEALVATGKPVAMVLFTGRPLALTWADEHVPAILNAWFAGSEAGSAITDVLFGEVNPSGRLTATFPQNVGQVPLYYNHKNTGRPLPEGEWFQKFRSNYLDVSNQPLYPFGYGLSYTTFDYGEVQLSKTELQGDETLQVSVDITNNGEYDGAEVVQLYIRDVVGSVTRPVKELKGFQKIKLAKGETQTVRFDITPDDLKFYNYDLEYVWEPGEFEIMVGRHAQDVSSKTVQWNK